MFDKPKKIDIMTILGTGKSQSEEEDSESSDSDLALKAVFKALKSDDFEGFKEGMVEWMNTCRSQGSTTEDSDE